MYRKIIKYIIFRVIFFLINFIPKNNKELKSPCCKKTMKQIGKCYGSDKRFLMCNKCGKSYWVDVIKREDNRGNKF